MNLKTNKSDLLGCLKTAIRAVPQKTNSPILENVLLRVEEGELRIVASDNALSILAKCPADGTGSACLPARTLYDMVSSLPDVDFTISVDGAVASLDYGFGHSTMPAYPVDDFPEINFSPTSGVYDGAVVRGAQLREVVKRSLPNIMVSGLRPILGGVFFNDLGEGKGIECVASDTATMSVILISGCGLARNFVVPAAAARVIAASEWDDDVKILTEEKAVLFCMGPVIIRTVDVIGKYPAYGTIIPATHESKMTASRQEVMSALRRMMVCADKNTQHLILNLDALHGCTMEARDLAYQRNIRETLTDVRYEGDDLCIGFRADFLERLVSGFSGEKVTICFNGPCKAALVESDGEPGRYVIMPIMVSKK